MTVPTPQKTWTITPNNRAVFTTLNAVMSNVLFGMKQFLKAHGYTVRGSSNGSAAPPANTLITDGVDRWASVTDAATRGANASAAQSWVILTDGSGVDTLIAYQGATDDTAFIAFSTGALWTTAATATFQPTATDSTTIASAQSLIGSSSIITDRMWFGWVDSEHKLFRFAFASGGSWCGQPCAVEIITSEVAAPTTISGPVWGFSVPSGSTAILNGTAVGVARKIVASVPAGAASVAVMYSMEWTGLVSNTLGTVKTELQGAVGYPILPLGIACTFTGYNGKLGVLIDWYQGRVTAGPGDVYGNKQWIAVSGVNGNVTAFGGMWPWDGSTDPILT